MLAKLDFIALLCYLIALVLQENCAIFMWQCRKIYANLLMLSVLLFTLGVSASPRVNRGWAGQQAWNNAAGNVEIRWECCSGEIIYRGQQITATAGSELEFVVPEKLDDILNAGTFAANMPENRLGFCAELLKLPCGRAPPEILFRVA